jgi:hypothetical protein
MYVPYYATLIPSYGLFKKLQSLFMQHGYKTLLSTAAWISRYYHTHLQSFELRNVVHYRTGFIT